jgi:hypothetical protein
MAKKIDVSNYKINDKDDFFKMVKSKKAIAEKAHKQESEDWLRFIRLYRMGKSTSLHVQQTDLKNKKDKQIANYVFNTIQTIIAATHDKRAEVSMLPRSSEDTENVDKAQALIDYDFDKQKIYEKVNTYTYPDSLLCGQGYVKAYWDYEETEQKKKKKVKKKKGIFKKKEVEEEREYSETVPLKDEPCVSVVNPFRLFKMPDADDLQDSEWVFEEIVLTPDEGEVMFGKRLKTDYKISVFDDWRKNSDVIIKEDVEKCCVYEGWGKVLGKDNKYHEVKCYFTDDELLEVQESEYQHGKHPYIELPGYYDFHCAYHMSEVQQIEHLQNELDTNRKTIAEHNKKMVNPQRRVEKGAVDNTNMKRLKDPRGGVIVELNAGKMNAVQDITPAPLSADVYNYDSIIKEDIARSTGVNEIDAGGGSSRQVETATGIAVMSEATQRRIREKVRKLERFYEEVAEMLIALYKQFGDRERLVRIKGKDNSEWPKFKPEDILGEYDFVAEAGSTMPVNKEARSARWLNIYKLFKDNEFINLYELTRKTMMEAGEIKDIDKYLNSPEEQEQEMQQQPAMPQQPPMGMPPQGAPPIPPQGAGMMGGEMPGAGMATPPGMPPQGLPM